ncbi:hypothetical protein G647_03381 [Cladophialophora carrionii CBS 160.54]|uniref:Microcystin LR degradation protein MlrC N-terminal domain-containing protein n=1 Tax=Cladophialophora carrionii CBS 160.54 TaxID=1279043 RepID=V9DDH2_9EURO|nr:uncharacterized protein G647_03381 [Cladophialophora carrionii CBS 160.54]ETI24012.1 hypothetical protein G647_03381 [Cladophialophora carrionii CBS 160.54]
MPPLGKLADWHGALIGHALPGGIVTRCAFEDLADEIIKLLEAIISSTTIHGLWYDIHGSMCVEDSTTSRRNFFAAFEKPLVTA